MLKMRIVTARSVRQRIGCNFLGMLCPAASDLEANDGRIRAVGGRAKPTETEIRISVSYS